jgi:DNA-binding CsgD family transcriptional regulator
VAIGVVDLNTVAMSSSLETRALRVVGEIMGLLDHAEFCHGLLSVLREEFAADWCALHELPADLPHTISLTVPEAPPELHVAFARLAHQNPLVEHYMTTPAGGAIRFSDLITRQQLHQLELYQEVYKRVGAEYQVAIRLPSAGPRLLGVALSRGDQDFTRRDCELLNLMRPYLIQSYRNALAYSHVSANIELEALIELGLTRRQAQVLAQIAIGRSDRATAEHLGLSPRTVQKHLELSYRTLGVRTRSQAADWVWAHAAYASSK